MATIKVQEERDAIAKAMLEDLKSNELIIRKGTDPALITKSLEKNRVIRAAYQSINDGVHLKKVFEFYGEHISSYFPAHLIKRWQTSPRS